VDRRDVPTAGPGLLNGRGAVSDALPLAGRYGARKTARPIGGPLRGRVPDPATAITVKTEYLDRRDVRKKFFI
jgi:hypothetical protein